MDNYWEALKSALEEKARSTAEKTGRTVQITPDPESSRSLMLVSTNKSMTVQYIPERDALRWETAGEYGFDRLEGPVASLAAVLLQRLFRR